MKDDNSITSGDVFNARDLTAIEVARGFIPPSAFYDLLSDAHCILEGPRGSGKTTLLKMLTPEAMKTWIAGNSDFDRPVSFVGVFVPADVRWTKQISIRLQRVKEEDSRIAVQQAAFATAISLELVTTLQQFTCSSNVGPREAGEKFILIGRNTESEIVRGLADMWGLSLGVPSFNGICHQLRKRQNELGVVCTQLAIGSAPHETFLRYSYLNNSWLQQLISGIETINDAIGRRDQKWAILLDELEIVPSSLMRSIVEALRSTDSRVRFKLALSPAGSNLIAENMAATANAGDDYRSIKLWYDKRVDARIFSEKLFRSALIQRGAMRADESITTLLRSSADYDAVDDDDLTDVPDVVREDSAHQYRIGAFVSLYSKDASFRHYLGKRRIDPENPPTKDSDPHGSLVRKITPIVKFRDQEIQEFAEGSEIAKRKGGPRGLQAYLGFPNLLDLTEGNPRWVLNLADALVTQSRDSGYAIGTQGVQSKAVRTFVEQFVAKLRVYPISGRPNSSAKSPYDFVEQLAKVISDSLFAGPFNPEPRMSFIADRPAVEQYGDFVNTCIDLGALVIAHAGQAPAPLMTGSSRQGIVDVRLRITYRLAPQFQLPLRYTKEQKMSSALRGGELLDVLAPRFGSLTPALPAPMDTGNPVQKRLL